MGTLCHRCDLFVGYGALGICRPPLNRDREWLADHCWICFRSRMAIQAENDVSAAWEHRDASGVDTSDPNDHGIVRRLP